MLKKIISSIFIFLFFGFSNVFAININPKIEKIYNKIFLKVEKKFNNDIDKEISYLSSL
jgi:hypothetical protein